MAPYNYFEEQLITNSMQPPEWRGESAQVELESFLQANWNQRKAFFNDNNSHSTQQFLSFCSFGKLRTNDYVGTITFKGCQVNIFPKMFRKNKNDEDRASLELGDMIRSLVNWINYCTKLEYPYLPFHTELDECESLKELFITLFIGYVKAAFSQGYFHQYVDRFDDLPSIKGKLNVGRYICSNVPSGRANCFPCEYSEFEFDNPFNRIIKCVCKLLGNETNSHKNRLELRKICSILCDVTDKRCSPGECDQVKIPFLHRRYALILSLCKVFLMNKTPTLNGGSNDSFCFLFPTDVLFEGFIGGFLDDMLSGKGKVKVQVSDEYLVNNVLYSGKSYGSAFQMKHDIVCEVGGSVFLMDTKYKMLQRFETAKDDDEAWRSNLRDGVKQTDLYQLTSYAVKRGLNKAYIIYPLFNGEDLESEIPILEELHVPSSVPSALKDLKIVDIYLLRVPFIFEKDIEITKKKLKKALDEVLFKKPTKA